MKKKITLAILLGFILLGLNIHLPYKPKENICKLQRKLLSQIQTLCLQVTLLCLVVFI